MNKAIKITMCLCFDAALVSLAGCRKTVDENKSVSEIRAEAEKMSVNDLKAMAEKYKNAILAKKADIEKYTNQLKDVPVGDLMGDKAKKLGTDVEKATISIAALTERFNIYIEKLREKGGDTSGLDI